MLYAILGGGLLGALGALLALWYKVKLIRAEASDEAHQKIIDVVSAQLAAEKVQHKTDIAGREAVIAQLKQEKHTLEGYADACPDPALLRARILDAGRVSSLLPGDDGGAAAGSVPPKPGP